MSEPTKLTRHLGSEPVLHSENAGEANRRKLLSTSARRLGIKRGVDRAIPAPLFRLPKCGALPLLNPFT
eukprot:8541670-Alexandrium_andersonii.AAC.1